MVVAAFFFYLFAGICVASAVMVIASRNPVHSVLFLILAFVNAAGLFVLLGAEFLAMILVVVYVGAVAVLFLFVVMMLDVEFAELRRGTLSAEERAFVSAALRFRWCTIRPGAVISRDRHSSRCATKMFSSPIVGNSNVCCPSGRYLVMTV